VAVLQNVFSDFFRHRLYDLVVKITICSAVTAMYIKRLTPVDKIRMLELSRLAVIHAGKLELLQNNNAGVCI